MTSLSRQTFIPHYESMHAFNIPLALTLRLENHDSLHILRSRIHGLPVTAPQVQRINRTCRRLSSASFPPLENSIPDAGLVLNRLLVSGSTGSMSYQIVFDVRDGIPTVELHGTKTLEVALEFWSKMQAFIEEKTLDRLIVIDKMDDELTVWDVADIEAQLTASGFPRSVYVAIVDHAVRDERNTNAFGELYAFNRGWHRLRAFETHDLAVAWLRWGDQADPSS
jgi:hypothetical protein